MIPLCVPAPSRHTLFPTRRSSDLSLDAEIITLKLGPPETTGPQVAFEVEVDLIAPELLGGVVAVAVPEDHPAAGSQVDRKSTRLNSSHLVISYAVFCLKKKT